MKAAVFIDVQNDFITGSLGNSPAQKITPEIIKFAKDCRAKGYALYATADTHFKTECNNDGKPIKGYLATLEGKNLPIEHCIEGTIGHQIADGLVKDEDGNVIIPEGHICDKYTFGSDELRNRIGRDFSDGILEDDLGALQEPLDEIFVCGFVTDICVVSNVLLLRERFPNVKITVVANLCDGTTPQKHREALSVMQSCQIDLIQWHSGLGFVSFDLNAAGKATD